MSDRPTEDTYTTELVSAIKQLGALLGFDAEAQRNGPSGKPDIKLLYQGSPVAIIEVKIPQVSLSDPSLKSQAVNYAEWYRTKQGVKFYGVHNLKYLDIFRYVGDQARKTLDGFIPEQTPQQWVSISSFPFKIMPWAKTIADYKDISTDSRARNHLKTFLLKFREILEGKTVDFSTEVIEIIRGYIEDGSSRGRLQLEHLYNSNPGVRQAVDAWFSERGFKAKDDQELGEFLSLLIKEQLYTFSMKVLFYQVLQWIDIEMASRLKQDISSINLSDPAAFKAVFDALFQYAIQKSGDFEEVFGENSVDKIPFVDGVMPPLNDLLGYLNQVRWSEASVDIIGRVFEGLIYRERRHLLGQHYTDTKVVDLILTPTLKDHGTLLDPSCGSGTFLVRAFNLWRARGIMEDSTYDQVRGVDIDKLAAMLSKVNLYIQALELIKKKTIFKPAIVRNDFFKLDVPLSRYVATNPPYTRQTELVLAFYDKDYKANLMKAVEGIPDWSNQASIYAYFLIKGGKQLETDGRLGFIVENSWLTAEYGGPLKRWFLENLGIEMIIESVAERWFEDAAIITNIIVAHKGEAKGPTRFIYLKKQLEELIGQPPPADDLTANRVYYSKIEDLLATGIQPILGEDHTFFENEKVRVFSGTKELLGKIEDKLGCWGFFRGPPKYVQLLVDFAEGKVKGLKQMGEVMDCYRGLTTNANDIFYLPSKYWEYVAEDDTTLHVKNPDEGRLSISKHYLRHLIRMGDVQGSTYVLRQTKKRKHEDYVLWVANKSDVADQGTKKYLEWAERHVAKEHAADSTSYPTIAGKLGTDDWTQLPDTSKGPFIFKNGIHKTFSFVLRGAVDSQVDKRLFLGTPKNQETSPEVTFACLNSVLTYLGMELMGRTNLGMGALDVSIVDYVRIPMVDPTWLQRRLVAANKLGDLVHCVEKLRAQYPVAIDKELLRSDRIKMDKLVLGELGMEVEVEDLYRGLVELVEQRETRSKTILNLSK